MFKKKKKAEQTADTQAVQTPEQECADFQKNIKTLWIYTSLFCVFALALILISSFIQGKIDKRAEYYQDQYENVQSSSQSTIKNIETENEALKASNEKYKDQVEFYKKQFETEEELVKASAEIIENSEYLLQAQTAVSNRDKDSARTALSKIDVNYLTDTMRVVYDGLKAELE